MKLLSIVFLSFVCLVNGAFGQSKFLSGSEELRKVPEAMIARVASGNLWDAIKSLRPYSVVASADYDLFEAQVNSQSANLIKQFGNPKGYEFVQEEKIGTRLVRHTYIVFHEKAPIRWTFVMYKVEKGWVVTHFNFEGNAMTFF